LVGQMSRRYTAAPAGSCPSGSVARSMFIVPGAGWKRHHRSTGGRIADCANNV
jgi:hypothetical protein